MPRGRPLSARPPCPTRILPSAGSITSPLKARNWPAVCRFYTEVLGFREKLAWTIGEGRRAAMLDLGDGTYLEIFEDPGDPPAANGAIPHFALRTADLTAALARVRAAGMKVTLEPRDATIQATNGFGPVPIRFAFFEGPAGELVELFQNDRT